MSNHTPPTAASPNGSDGARNHERDEEYAAESTLRALREVARSPDASPLGLEARLYAATVARRRATGLELRLVVAALVFCITAFRGGPRTALVALAAAATYAVWVVPRVASRRERW